MLLRNEIALGVGSLLAVQVLTTIAAIGLLARTAPAVERILEDNVVSLTAAEEMLVVLARGQEEDAARFFGALERARTNVTEPEEEPLVRAIAAVAPGALAGDAAARAATVDALTGLAEVNRESMERMSRTARAVGSAGAWATVFLGLVGFGLGVRVSRRISRRIRAPLAELDATLLAAAQGDRLRRCAVTDAPQELERIAREVNVLLDRRLADAAAPPMGGGALDRAALLAFLDDADGPVAVVDGRGGLHAANLAAQDLLYGPDGVALREALGRVHAGEGGAAILHARPFDGGWVCRLAP